MLGPLTRVSDPWSVSGPWSPGRPRTRDLRPGRVVADGPWCTVESWQHDGAGRLRLAVYANPFVFLQLTAESMTVTPTWLDARRPPHVKVRWDYGSFGIWDEGPGTGPFLPEELDLPPRLRDRIEAWCDRCEDGDEDPVEQDAIAAELRRAWPESVVRVHR